MKIVIAGATGFIGKALRKKFLAAGHEVTLLVRHAGAGETELEKFVAWDGRTAGDWAKHLDGADAVINLAGENIASKRWTAARKAALLSSRVDATRAIVQAIGAAREKPVVLINASAAGYYGPCPISSRKVDKDRPNFNFVEIEKYWDRPCPRSSRNVKGVRPPQAFKGSDPFCDVELTETSPRGGGFLSETCVRWESEARKAESPGVRVVLARFGPVLGEKGGMLAKMLPPFRFFMGAPLGSGRQWIPWVHLDDVAGIFLFLLEHPEISGPVNVTAPAPATMSGFCVALAKVLGRPCWFPVPAFLLRLFLGEMATVVLGSQKAMPAKLLQAGYRFRYPELPAALEAILKDRG
jgi:hypothetical protein